MLLQSRKLESFSTLSRILVAVATIVLAASSRFSASLESEVVKLLILLALCLGISSYFKGLRVVLGGLKMLFLFVLLGLAVFAASWALGLLAPEPLSLIPGALRLVTLFTSLSIAFQLVSPREWRALFKHLGLARQAEILSLAILQLPLVLNYLSEAAVTVRLKYRGRCLHKLAVPLVVLVAYTSRSLYEAHLLYGVSYGNAELTVFKKRDFILYLLLLLAVVAYLAVEPALRLVSQGFA